MTVTKSYNVSSCYLELDLIVIAYSRLTYIYKIGVLNKELIQKRVKSTLQNDKLNYNNIYII